MALVLFQLLLLLQYVAMLVVASPPSTASDSAVGWFMTPKTVMPWLCLERCANTTREQVLQHVETLKAHRDVVSAVSFERFNLGPNSTLVVNSDLTNVAPILKAAGFVTVAMVSSFPYPPEFIVWMRQVFANPGPFMQNLLAELIAHSIDGVNIDWEPTTGVLPGDAASYAAFLSDLRAQLSAHGKFVSVDAATWSPIWNLTALNTSMAAFVGGGSLTPVLPGYVATMSTYVQTDAVFLQEAAVAAKSIKLDNLIVGLETWPGELTTANVTLRFVALEALGVKRVAIWRSPIPDFWWGIIRGWARVPY